MPPVDFLPANEITFVRRELIPPSAAHEAAVAESWRTAIERNPNLFNGPLVSPRGATISGGMCTVRWHHSDFAHYSFSRQNRDLPIKTAVGTVFVSVAVPTTDERLVVGRMSGNTSTPGAVQLPGGGVSIGREQTEVAERDLIATAVQEASEEIGIILDPASLRICGIIKRHRPPDIGVVFATEPRAWHEVETAFTALRQREQQAGVVSEFDELLAVGASRDLTNLSAARGEVIDYLPAVVAALLKSSGGVA